MRKISFTFILAMLFAFGWADDQNAGKSADDKTKQKPNTIILIPTPNDWTKSLVDKMQIACKKADYVTLDIKGSYAAASDTEHKFRYALHLVFEAPNKVMVDLTEYSSDAAPHRVIVSDGEKIWYYRQTTNELSYEKASKKRGEFINQIELMLPNDNSFVLRGLAGDWHWFSGMALEDAGTERQGELQKVRANLDNSSGDKPSEKQQHLERYEFSLFSKTSLPQKMFVSYNHQSASADGFIGEFEATFDFDKKPSGDTFKKQPPKDAKVI